MFSGGGSCAPRIAQAARSCSCSCARISALTMCFYTLRGSFKGKKQTELREGMKQHRAVKEEWFAARTSGLVQSAQWNTTPYRHNAIPSSYQPHVTGSDWILGIGSQLDGSWTGLDNSNHVAVGSMFFRRWMDWESLDFVIADFGCRLRRTKCLQASEGENSPQGQQPRPKGQAPQSGLCSLSSTVWGRLRWFSTGQKPVSDWMYRLCFMPCAIKKNSPRHISHDTRHTFDLQFLMWRKFRNCLDMM